MYTTQQTNTSIAIERLHRSVCVYACMCAPTILPPSTYELQQHTTACLCLTAARSRSCSTTAKTATHAACVSHVRCVHARFFCPCVALPLVRTWKRTLKRTSALKSSPSHPDRRHRPPRTVSERARMLHAHTCKRTAETHVCYTLCARTHNACARVQARRWTCMFRETQQTTAQTSSNSMQQTMQM